MNFKDFIKQLKNKVLNRMIRLPEHVDYYLEFAEFIDDIDLIEMFEKKMSDNLKTIVFNSKGNVYNYLLITKIQRNDSIQIVKDFFSNIDDELSKKINNIINGKDNKFNLCYDSKWNGENATTNPKEIPIEINVTEFGDLRDVYGLVHELTHCLDVDNGDTDARRILGEVAPQCMERLLDQYLIANCDSYGLNKEILLNDIDKRILYTFISRAQNAIHFNDLLKRNSTTRTLDQEKDSRYVLAQIYSSKFMKEDIAQVKNKIVKFIKNVKNNDFYGANEIFEINLENDKSKEELISTLINEAEQIYNNAVKNKTNKLNDDKDNEFILKLLEQIKQGKTNEDIINERIEYLYSDKYKSKKIDTIYEKESIIGTNITIGEDNVVILKEGFIEKAEVIDYQSGKITWSNGYLMDDISIYNDVIDYLRENFEQISKRNGLNKKDIKGIIVKIRNYFKLSTESKYYDTCIYLENWYRDNEEKFVFEQEDSKLFVRYELPEIIGAYNVSDFEGTIKEFAELYIDSVFNYRYGIKDGYDQYRDINIDENKLFTSLNISEVKGTGAVACTEYAMMLQNCLSFLGYDTYMVGGKENGHGHNYNVIRDKNGKFRVFDVGMLVYGEELNDIDNPMELLNFGERTVINARNDEIVYSSEFKNMEDDLLK